MIKRITMDYAVKKLLLSLIFIAFVINANAAAVFSALIPDSGETHALVTLMDTACDVKTGNANILTPTRSLKGCWTLDGLSYKVTLLGTNEVKVFPKAEFKFMGDTTGTPSSKPEATKLSTVLTCIADAWKGDVTVERNSDTSLKAVFVSGERVNAAEQANAINFSFGGLNISLSTLTGVFNYDTAGFQSFLNFKMGRSNTKGTGFCNANSAPKKF